jgi:hypothetical protein
MRRTVRAGRPRTRLKQAWGARGWAEGPFPRCREDPVPQTPSVALDPLPVDRPPRQGLALRSVHPRPQPGRPTCPLVPASPSPRSSPAHLTHVGALSGRGTRPVSGQFPAGSRWEERPDASRSCRRSARRHWLVGSSCARWAVRLPHGRPTESASDPIGVATLPARELRPGWVPSLLPGVRCPHGRHRQSGRRRPPPSGPPLDPGAASTSPGLG